MTWTCRSFCAADRCFAGTVWDGNRGTVWVLAACKQGRNCKRGYRSIRGNGTLRTAEIWQDDVRQLLQQMEIKDVTAPRDAMHKQ
jgi:hypothetical protein